MVYSLLRRDSTCLICFWSFLFNLPHFREKLACYPSEGNDGPFCQTRCVDLGADHSSEQFAFILSGKLTANAAQTKPIQL
jgi:hypothetical protein